jgi:uncharacterized protein YndB with AHSA1/START domain
MAEVKVDDEVRIDAPLEEVWQAIKEPAAHARWHPFVTHIGGEHRLGAARTCSVIVGKRTGRTTERCIEEEQARAIAWEIEEDSTGFSRMVSDWRAGFRLERHDGGALVTAHSAFEPRNVFVRLITPLIRRKFHQTQKVILDALKRSVEA